MYRLLFQLNGRLGQRGFFVQQGGGMIDASTTPTARKAQGKSTYMFSAHPNAPPTKEVRPCVDRKNLVGSKRKGKLQNGYKRHYLAAEGRGLSFSSTHYRCQHP